MGDGMGRWDDIWEEVVICEARIVICHFKENEQILKKPPVANVDGGKKTRAARRIVLY